MLKIEQVRHHRNGVSGESFAAVAFSEGRGRNKRHLLAAVFDTPGHIAVLSATPGTVADRWRGDDYEPELRAAIAAAEVDGSIYAC